MIERADKTLAWLLILVLIIGGLGTTAVVFTAEIILANVSSQPISIDLEVAVPMNEVAELHHWLAYEASTAQNDFEANYHVEQALTLATDADHQSLLDGLLREHLPSGHFFHAEDTVVEILELANKRNPELSFTLLHASLAHLLLAEGNTGEAQETVEHLMALATGTEKEQGQKILDALTAGDTQTASLLLTELSGKGGEAP